MYVCVGIYKFSCKIKYSVCIGEKGHQEYNDVFHICCNGELQKRVWDQACCGKEIYFQSTQLCCGDQIVSRYLSYGESGTSRHCTSNSESCREQTCCGHEVLDKFSTLCCEGTQVLLSQKQILERDFLQCCGVNVMNRTTHFCCGGSALHINSPFSCCGDTIYQRSDKKCLDEFDPPILVNTFESYCENLKYDTRKNSCCSGLLNSVPEVNPTNSAEVNPHRECCDHIVYNSTKNKCCRAIGTVLTTHIIPNEPTIHCCGDGWYNDTHQDCYKGIVLEKMPGKTRCADNYIDGVREKCCGDILSYDTSSHDCCIGDHISIVPKNMICCNGEGVNDDQLCCEDITRCNKRLPDDDGCCYNSRTHNGTTYNSKKNEFCVDEEIMIVPPEAKPCSRSNYYYPATQICCSGRVENKSSGYDDCCGMKPYKSISQQCCDNEISNIPLTEGRCCLRDFTVYKFGDPQNPCLATCGSKTYDAVTQVCCEGMVHTRHENTECCGTSAIITSTTECCGEMFPYSRSGTIRCCGDRELFDNKHSKCQNKKIVPRMFVEKNQPDVQRLCNNKALLHFDGAIRYACETDYVIHGRLAQVLVHKDINPEIIYIRLSLVDVRNVNRGANFPSLTGQQNLNFTIEVPNTNGVECRKRYLDRCCNVFVFFRAEVKNGHVTISKDAKFFMAKYNRKRENMITKHLPYKYCVEKFGVGRKKP
ncbi:unnamed protein product [Candidula unifasciata]|uniref:Galaxin-like repeats domain-containing protein n=1 Tax=Candidula unifasciata TaxID=100452 RepID=A0A8S3ZTQ8_9EUPU|nr:unnamed protein product [Candidula unifasciata]